MNILNHSHQDSEKTKPTITSFRNILLEEIYQKEHIIQKKTQFNKTETLLVLPRVQLCKTKNKVQMYNTSSEVYYLMEDYLVLFAYLNGLQKLSDSLCYTFKSNELDKVRRRKAVAEEDQNRKQVRIDTLVSAINKLKSKNVINLKSIKDEYTQRFIQATKGE